MLSPGIIQSEKNVISMSLVSVIISTYNSACFIAETLESVREQTWNEIELIITDDRSSDETLEICKRWLENNNDRFVKTQLITSRTNTGVSANANRGLKAAKGEWVKFLGADDTLLPGCLEANIEHLRKNPQIKILFSNVCIYNDNFLPINLLYTTEDDSFDQKSIMHPSRSAYSQYKMLLISDRIHYAPSVFMHRDTLLSVGGFDEKVKLMEDYPLWLKLTREGHKLHFMNTITVNYRRHSRAVNNKNQNVIVNPNYFKTETFRKKYTYPMLPSAIRNEQRINWILSQIFRWSVLNRNNLPNRLLYKVLTTYMNPLKCYIYFSKKIRNEFKDNDFYN